jgi:hypothetical protein
VDGWKLVEAACRLTVAAAAARILPDFTKSLLRMVSDFLLKLIPFNQWTWLNITSENLGMGWSASCAGDWKTGPISPIN